MVEYRTLEENREKKQKISEVVRGGTISRTIRWKTDNGGYCSLMYYPAVLVAYHYTFRASDGKNAVCGRGRTAKEAYQDAGWFWRYLKFIGNLPVDYLVWRGKCRAMQPAQ